MATLDESKITAAVDGGAESEATAAVDGGAQSEATAAVDGGVALDEALERLLPHCDGCPHQAAERINLLCRTAVLALHVGGVAIAPASVQAGMLVVVGRISPTGAKSLEGMISGGWHPDWRHAKPAFTLERASFEKYLRGLLGARKNRGGRPAEYSKEDLFAEALVCAGFKGLPRSMTGIGSLHEQLQLRMSTRCPGEAQFKEFFGPIYQRIKDEPRR
jgi:hypothetical protein